MTKILVSVSIDPDRYRDTFKDKKEIERRFALNKQQLEQKQKTLNKYKAQIPKLEQECADLQNAIDRDIEWLERLKQ